MTADARIDRLQKLRRLKELKDQRAAQSVQEVQDQPLGARIAESAIERQETVQEVRGEFERGEARASEVGLEAVAESIGFAGDVIGETVGPTVKKIAEATPEPIKKELQFGLETLVSQKPVQLGLQALGAAEEKFPRATRAGKNILTIGAIAAPTGKAKAAKTGAITDLGKKVEASGVKSLKDKKSKFAQDLTAPVETKRFVEEQSKIPGRFKESPVRKKRELVPTDFEKSVADEVAKLPVSSNKSFLANQQVIAEEIGKEAESLVSLLEKEGHTFRKTDVKNRLASRIDELVENEEFLVGNSETSARKVLDIAFKEIDKAKGKASGLLEARKVFDKRVGKKAALTREEAAVDNVVKALRTEMNNIIEDAAPSVAVKKSLGKQSRLFSAKDNIGPKVSADADEAIKRLTKKVVDVVPGRTAIGKTAGAGLALGAAGAGVVAAPVAAGVGILSSAALNSVSGRKALGQLLQFTDKAISVEKSADALKQLKADRLLLIDLLEEDSE